MLSSCQVIQLLFSRCCAGTLLLPKHGTSLPGHPKASPRRHKTPAIVRTTFSTLSKAIDEKNAQHALSMPCRRRTPLTRVSMETPSRAVGHQDAPFPRTASALRELPQHHGKLPVFVYFFCPGMQYRARTPRVAQIAAHRIWRCLRYAMAANLFSILSRRACRPPLVPLPYVTSRFATIVRSRHPSRPRHPYISCE